jgi:hypothetical protein
MPTKPTADAFFTVPAMVTLDQTTVTMLEVACT